MRRLLIAILSVALLAAACSGGPASEEVATVDGNVVTVDDVSELFSTDEIPIDNGFRTAAFRLIALDVLEEAYEEQFGLEVDDDVVQTQYEAFMADIAAQGMSVAEALGIADATENMIQFDARLTVIRDGVIDELVKGDVLLDELKATLESDPASMATVCVRHILVTNEDDADTAMGRLEAGEDFATVANEMSQDETPGGDLGCSSPGIYVTEFADASMEAEVGAIHGPVLSSFGLHIMVVYERTLPSEDDLAADPGAYFSSDRVQGLWIDWIQAHLAMADITVNPKFGVWDPGTLRIVAPPEE